MPRALSVLIAAAFAALVSACATTTGHVPDLPPACPPATPEVQIVERRVYVPIRRELLQTEAVAEGPLSECPMVAAARRAAIERLNARIRAIAEQEGTEVKP